MRQIFVFTAGNPEARQHLADSTQSPIDDPQAKVFDKYDEAYHGELERIRDEAGGFYAWGAVRGIKNLPTLNVHFLGAVSGGRITCESEVLHRTPRTATAEAKVRDVESNLVALGTRAFRVFEKKGSAII